MRTLARAPGVMELLKDAKIDDEIRVTSDYSYSAASHAGPGWRLAGDAGAFIDPLFSSGVHLALHGGLTAAISILGSLRGTVSEKGAAAYHDKIVTTSYTRFLMAVLAAYKQLHHQHLDILSDVHSGNYDTAFNILRPVIQGLADVEANHSRAVTEDTLCKTIDFITTVLTIPISSAVNSEDSPNNMLERDAYLLAPYQIAKLVSATGVNVNSTSLRDSGLQLSDSLASFENKQVFGMIADFQRGNMGLRAVDFILVPVAP